MKITLQKVAEEAQVSLATASAVINDEYSDVRVSEGTVKTVKAVAEKLNYRPHFSAKALASRKAHVIGMAIYSLDYLPNNYYFAKLASETGYISALHNYSVQFLTTCKPLDVKHQNLHYRKKIEERCVDGLLIADQVISDDEILWLKENRVPFVLIDRDVPGEDVCCVTVDFEKAAYNTTKHLITLGHKKIAFIFAGSNFYKTKMMLSGYRLALSEADIPFDPYCVRVVSPDNIGVYQIVEELLKLNQSPTAFLSWFDVYAVETLRAIGDNGLDVPKDIEVIGFDDIPIATSIRPALTTVKTPLAEMGELATEMLFKILNHEKIEQNKIFIEPELIIRDSCR